MTLALFSLLMRSLELCNVVYERQQNLLGMVPQDLAGESCVGNERTSISLPILKDRFDFSRNELSERFY